MSMDTPETGEDRIDRSKMVTSETEVAVDIVDMHKWYGDFHVLRDINLKVMKGERIVIAGPSGSGKSTLIRCINRLEEHQEGKIEVDGIELTNDLKAVDEVRREVGMVFQHFNLFPASDHPAELHAGPDLGARHSQGRGRGDRHALSRDGQDSRAGPQVPWPAFGRAAAARRHRALRCA